MDPAVRTLLDRAEIYEVLVRYCRAVDRLDEALLRSCFHPGSQHDHGYVGPSETFVGFALDVLKGCVATHHQLGNVSIAVRGDEADCESYFTAYHRVSLDPPQAFADAAGLDLIIGGRYVDRLERRSGDWRIVRRVGVHDWRRYEAPADRAFFDVPEEQRGRRNRDDPVYQRDLWRTS
jgi:hypothetical protein